MTRYRTKEGDSVDAIAWKHYGTRRGAAEAVLDANRGLADAGALLPAGLLIDLPDLPAAPTVVVLRIWG